MSLMSTCCCSGPKPPDWPACCDCIASSYSIALDLSWTQDTYDATGNKASADCDFSYSGKTVIASPCASSATRASTRFDPSNSIGSITNANISFALTPIDPGFNCVNRSVSSATLDSPAASNVACGQADFAPASSLVCLHYTKSDGSTAYRWYHQSCFRTQVFDPVAFCYYFGGNINARSPEQSTCHVPPSSGWEIIGGFSPSGLTSSRIEHCDGNLPCETQSPLHPTASNLSFSLTIT